jgi:hypothetical protein
MRIIYKITFSLVLLFGAGLYTWAQTQNSLYFMNGIPQANRVNPARSPDCGFYIGIPILSTLSTQLSSNPLAYEDVIYPHPTEDSLITFLHPLGDQEAFLKKLKPLNVLLADTRTSFISIGFGTEAGFFTLDLITRADATLYFPGDLAKLVLEGADDGRVYNMDGTGLDFSGFDEIALGWSRAIGSKWQIGVRGKALFGFGNLSTSRSELEVSTSEELWNIQADMEFNASLPFAEVVYDEDGNIEDIIIEDEISSTRPSALFKQAFNAKNFGLAVDLGVDYRPTDRWLLSASVLDIGYIHWTDEVHKVSFKTDYDYLGLEVNPFEFTGDLSFGDYMDSSFSAMADSLAGGLEFTPGGAYNSSLNPKLYEGASWWATPNINFGLLSRTDFLREVIFEQLTASANFAAGRILNFTLSYTYTTAYWKNIGAGISLNAGPLNLYLISDNTLNALFWSEEARAVNFWFGVNLVFGYKECWKKDQDRPLVY